MEEMVQIRRSRQRKSVEKLRDWFNFWNTHLQVVNERYLGPFDAKFQCNILLPPPYNRRSFNGLGS